MSARALAVFVVAVAAGSGCYHDGEPRPAGCDFEDGAVRVPNEGWTHVDTDDQLVYAHNPPASGPHFDVWLGYTVHTGDVSRGNWVHNLEHGAVVLLIGPDASDAERQQLLDAYDAIPDDPDCGHRRALVVDDPLLDSRLAVVAADVVLEDVEMTVERVVAFAEACRDRAPEDICF